LTPKTNTPLVEDSGVAIGGNWVDFNPLSLRKKIPLNKKLFKIDKVFENSPPPLHTTKILSTPLVGGTKFFKLIENYFRG